jgi:hypothetical protein
MGSRRRRSLIGMAAGTVFVCAILAGTGSAAHQPGSAQFRTAAEQPSLDLFAQSTALAKSGGIDLEIYRPALTGQFAQFSIFVPSGFDLGLSRAVGTKVGSLVAWEAAGTPHLGPITVDDPAKHTADQCSTGTHQAVWVLAPAGMSPLPAYIDQTSGTETALGGYKIVICVPSSTTSGLTLDQFDIAPNLTNPSSAGFYMWRVFVTPYLGTVPNPSGVYEVRSREPLPISLYLRGRDVKGRAVLTGQLVAPAAPTRGLFIDLYTERSGLFRYTTYTKTAAAGRFSFSRRIRKTTRFYAEIDSYRGCQEASVAPAGCISETMVSASSPNVRVRVPKRR